MKERCVPPGISVVVRGPIITSALKLASPGPSPSSSSTFNRILLSSRLSRTIELQCRLKGRVQVREKDGPSFFLNNYSSRMKERECESR